MTGEITGRVQVRHLGAGGDEAARVVAERVGVLQRGLDPRVLGRDSTARLAAVDDRALDGVGRDHVAHERHVQRPVPVGPGSVWVQLGSST
ncbi:MAG: hypothetical protein U0168_23345 [Nannocystaceae bacterium]